MTVVEYKNKATGIVIRLSEGHSVNLGPEWVKQKPNTTKK